MAKQKKNGEKKEKRLYSFDCFCSLVVRACSGDHRATGRPFEPSEEVASSRNKREFEAKGLQVGRSEGFVFMTT